MTPASLKSRKPKPDETLFFSAEPKADQFAVLFRRNSLHLSSETVRVKVGICAAGARKTRNWKRMSHFRCSQCNLRGRMRASRYSCLAAFQLVPLHSNHEGLPGRSATGGWG